MIDNTSAIIFNRSLNHQTGEVTYIKTVIPAVHWEDSVLSDQDKTSNAKRRNAFVSISFAVKGRMEKEYVAPEAYAKLMTEDRQRRWTLGIGDVLIKGSSCEEIPDKGFRKWMVDHPEASSITRVDIFDLCMLKHWEVYTE